MNVDTLSKVQKLCKTHKLELKFINSKTVITNSTSKKVVQKAGRKNMKVTLIITNNETKQSLTYYDKSDTVRCAKQNVTKRALNDQFLDKLLKKDKSNDRSTTSRSHHNNSTQTSTNHAGANQSSTAVPSLIRLPNRYESNSNNRSTNGRSDQNDSTQTSTNNASTNQSSTEIPSLIRIPPTNTNYIAPQSNERNRCSSNQPATNQARRDVNPTANVNNIPPTNTNYIAPQSNERNRCSSNQPVTNQTRRDVNPTTNINYIYDLFVAARRSHLNLTIQHLGLIRSTTEFLYKIQIKIDTIGTQLAGIRALVYLELSK